MLKRSGGTGMIGMRFTLSGLCDLLFTAKAGSFLLQCSDLPS